MTIGWGYGRRWIGMLSIQIARIFIREYYLQYTNFLSLSDKESMTVIPVYTLRKIREIKTVSVLTRLLCSLVPWRSLNWLNGWGRENTSVDCKNCCTQKKEGKKVLRYRRRECLLGIVRIILWTSKGRIERWKLAEEKFWWRL